MYRTESCYQAGNDACDNEPGTTGTGGVIHSNTEFREGLKSDVDNITCAPNVVNDEADVSSSDREDKARGGAISSRKRRAVDLGANCSLSHGDSDAGALKERQKRAKRERQKSRNKGRDGPGLRSSDD